MTIFPNTTAPPQQIPASVQADPTLSNKQRFARRPGVLSLASLSKRGSGSVPPQQQTTSPPTTPPASVNQNPGVPTAGALPVDPSRLSQFSLRLSELVNKAFVANQNNVSSIAHSGTSPFTGTSISVPRIQNIVYGNSRLPNRVHVIEMTRLIVDELHNAEQVDPYLLRAVSRTILKSVSQFVTRIESQLVSPRTDPSALQVPSSLRGTQHVSQAMEFNLALISIEWIVEESLERCLEGLPPLALLHSPNILVSTAAEGLAQPRMPGFVHDILSPLRGQMEASIIHVVQPLLVSVKSSITICLKRANAHPFQPQTSPPLVSDFDPSCTEKRQSWHKELEERLDAAYRLLMLRIVDRCGQDGQAWFISVAIHTIWKGLLTLTARSVFAPASVVEAEFSHTFGRTSGAMHSSMVLNSLLSGEQAKRVPTPTQLAHALRNVSRTASTRKWRGGGESSTGTHTPEVCAEDFELWRGQFALPATETDCFVINPLLVAEQLHDLQVFERLMRQFCVNFYPPKSPKHARHASGDSGESVSAPVSPNAPDSKAAHTVEPSADGSDGAEDEEDLAHEALCEAFDAMHSTIVVLRTLLKEPDALQHIAQMDQHAGEEGSLSPAAVHAFQVIPSLLLLQIAFCRIPPGWVQQRQSDSAGLQLMDNMLAAPPQVFQYSWKEYEAALPGFASAEAAALSLSDRYEPILRRVFDALDKNLSECDHDQLPSFTSSRDEMEAGSDDSNDESPAHMTQSMPALDTFENGKPNKTHLSMAMSNMTVDDSLTRQSERSHRRSHSPLAPRLWRRNVSQGPKTTLQHAPPRVSRAHATSSFGLTRGRPTHRGNNAVCSSLPRSTKRTLAHMQRNALVMFDNVLRRVPEMHSDE